METIKTGDGLTPEKPRGHIRGIWAITIIVVIAILVGGGVWYWYYRTTVQDTGNLNTAKISPSASPTPSGSASASPSTSTSISWKTYTNNTYKYSFEYPTSTKACPGTTEIVMTIGNSVQFCYGDRSSFNVGSADNYNHVATIEDYLKNENLKDYQKTKIAGETAYSISGKFGSYREITYFMHNDRIYTIDGSFGGGEDYECGGAINDTPCGTPSPKETSTQVVYDKIISSFKFL